MNIDIMFFRCLIAFIIIIILNNLRQWWRLRIKEKVIDNLCKDNHNLIKGRSDLVWKRMQGDMGKAFRPTRWQRVKNSRRLVDKAFIGIDKSLKMPFVHMSGQSILDTGENFYYWAPLPKDIEN